MGISIGVNVADEFSLEWRRNPCKRLVEPSVLDLPVSLTTEVRLSVSLAVPITDAATLRLLTLVLGLRRR